MSLRTLAQQAVLVLAAPTLVIGAGVIETSMMVIAVIVFFLLLVVAAWLLLWRLLRKGEQPVSTSWGKQFRRPKD